MGLVVLVVFGWFGWFFICKTKTGLSPSNYYTLSATFSNIDGVGLGTEVKIAGYKVGEVGKIYLDENYNAVVEITMSKSVKVPSDSSLQITSSGLLGGKFLNFAIGADDELLKDGGKIEFTRSSVSLESLLEKVFLKQF